MQAPPIMTLLVQPFSRQSSTTSCMRIIVVVMSADSPMIAAFSRIAVSTMVSAGTSFPRSMTW
jgi:hypothetical protein